MENLSNANSMSGRTYENEDQNSAQYGARDSYYANPTNASTAGGGGFYTNAGPGGGDILQGRITAIPAVNGAWTVHMMTNFRRYSSGSSNNRYPVTNTAFLMPSETNKIMEELRQVAVVVKDMVHPGNNLVVFISKWIYLSNGL